MQKQLILYGTLGCHLCEDAEHILQALALTYESTDIMDDNHLLEKFSTSIPVLQAVGNDNTLNWPFTEAQIIAWLDHMEK